MKKSLSQLMSELPSIVEYYGQTISFSLSKNPNGYVCAAHIERVSDTITKMGDTYVIDGSKLGSDITPKQLIQDMKTMGVHVADADDDREDFSFCSETPEGAVSAMINSLKEEGCI